MTNFINLKWPLTKHDRGFFQGNATTLKAVSEDIKILLLTSKGERVINTEVGTSIKSIAGELFENVSKSELFPRIREEIITAIETWMPHVKITDIKIFSYEDNVGLEFNQLRVKIAFVLANAENLGDSLQIIL